MKVIRKIIKIDDELCDGCGNCVVGCAEGALKVIDGKARVIAEKFCDGLGACIGECPTGALEIVEREADEFDEAAVETHLFEGPKKQTPPTFEHRCPSADLKVFPAAADCPSANQPIQIASGTTSTLSHWPIQIRLIPPTAPFLKNADLLVLADCGAVTLSRLQEDFVRGRVVMMGCPKFDDTKDYQERFRQIFVANAIESITVVRIEVPCCSGLPMLVKQALVESRKNIPLKEVVVSARGQILETRDIGFGVNTGKTMGQIPR